jgi:hypothetical protein
MDNRYFKYGCPGVNIDSRNLTNYYDSRSFEQFIRTTNNIGSAQDYKSFLQRNANTIMERENSYLVNNNTCMVDGRCNTNNVPVARDNKQLRMPSFTKNGDVYGSTTDNTTDGIVSIPKSEYVSINGPLVSEREFQDKTVMRQGANQAGKELTSAVQDKILTANQNSYTVTGQVNPVVRQSRESVPVPIPVFKSTPINNSDKVLYERMDNTDYASFGKCSSCN